MARVHGKDLASVQVADSGSVARDLRPETIALNFEVSAQTHDTTTIGDQWIRATAGLKGGDEFDHEVFYDNVAATGTHALYAARLGGPPQTFSFGDGVRTVSMTTIVTQISEAWKVDEMTKMKVTHKITGAVTFS